MAKCICPKCKSENIIPIMYGYPAPEAMEAATAGELKLGGCEVYIDECDMPDKFCKLSISHIRGRVEKFLIRMRFVFHQIE